MTPYVNQPRVGRFCAGGFKRVLGGRWILRAKAPGLFVFLGSTKKGVDPTTAPANHSPLYEVDEGVLPLGVRTLANLAIDFLSSPDSRR